MNKINGLVLSEGGEKKLEWVVCLCLWDWGGGGGGGGGGWHFKGATVEKFLFFLFSVVLFLFFVSRFFFNNHQDKSDIVEIRNNRFVYFMA